MIIAIDGGAATGKTTIAKLLSEKINFLHLNSGLIYRGITHVLFENKFLNKNESFYKQFLKNINFEVTGDKYNVIRYNNKNITNLLHDKYIAENISFVSDNAIIRDYITKLQRKISTNINVVCEGRDIGTVVFPFADYKFFLNADINVRVERRYQQYLKNNIQIEKKQIKKMLIRRDHNDINRQVSPLIKAKDAMKIDTTNKTVNEQIDIIIEILNKGQI